MLAWLAAAHIRNTGKTYSYDSDTDQPDRPDLPLLLVRWYKGVWLSRSE